MRATKIYYEELRTFGQYNNRKVGIELEVGEGEKAADVMHKARLFAQAQLSSECLNPALLENLVRSLESAQNAIDRFAEKTQEALPLNDEIPF